VPPCLLEGLLSDVLRGGAIADDSHGDAVHDLLKTAHEGERELGVARAEAREQYLIGQLLRGSFQLAHINTYDRGPVRDWTDATGRA
jgi:hypothetical protein